MADEVEITKNSLDVLNQASELASKFTALSKILGIAGTFTSAFPFVGAVMGLIECFLPDDKHEEILRRFDELSNKIDKVRDDIKELEKMIKWEITELQYGVVVNQIKSGMRLCLKIGKGNGEDKKRKNQQRLMEVCACPNITLSLNALFAGIIGNGLFQKSILDEFYNKTGGDRPNVAALATRLLQLVCGGMMVFATYETVKRGKEDAKEEIEQFDGQLNDVCAKVQSVLDVCVKNFKENMLNDLNSKLDEGGSNEELVTKIKDFMHDKYDWLEIFCLVYNDLQGFEKHCFNGFRVNSLHRNGKCGIVFYRTKDEPPRFSDRYDEAFKVVVQTLYHPMSHCTTFSMFSYSYNPPNIYAELGYKNIVAKIDERGIGWTGCAVIKRHADLRFADTFSTKIVRFDLYDAIAILLLR